MNNLVTVLCSINYNSPGLLLIDASAKMCLNKHYDQVIEFKGEYGSWDWLAPALYPFTFLPINAV